MFHAPTFRVAVPGPGWDVTTASDTELTLRHRGARAGILANADCGAASARGDLEALARRLFVGFHGRAILERDAAAVGGLPARHAVMEAQVTGDDDRMRVEAYVVKDERCVYDLVYVAPVAAAPGPRDDFQRFVDSFTRE